ncbi:MAG: DEAD/DEAH box helicase [Planctomycetaceae bacterium]
MADVDGLRIRTWRGDALAVGGPRVRTIILESPPAGFAVLSLPMSRIPVPTVRSWLLSMPSQAKGIVHSGCGQVGFGPADVRVRSYRFDGTASSPSPPIASDIPALQAMKTAHAEGGSLGVGRSGRRRERVRPPRDVVKLADRFFYLLQPDVETLVSSGGLTFPKNPYPFQLAGIAFLLPRQEAVLADEMGLGKSMQAISAIRLLVRLGQARRVLVICPKGLVSNWRRELAEWAGELPVAVVDGDPARRRWVWGLKDVPVTLAHYESVVRDRAVVEEAASPYDLVVLDEAQRIKNRGNQTSSSVRAIRRRRSWALTGTPIENSPADLVGLFEFVSPGLVDDAMGPRALGDAVSDHVLRRRKEEVLDDLPPRTDHDERIELTSQQREAYRLAEEEGVLRLTSMGRTITIRHVFELVLRLKQICNFDPASGASAKLERLEAELDEVRSSGRKAIVFSQWVETLERLERKLVGFRPTMYHGGLSTSARDAAIRSFREDPDRTELLLSYGAGAVGLNLQFSQYVFLFDRWWNPAVEDQAINRAHRIGATGAVTVTRFLCTETIEERIDAILESKRSLSEVILSEAGASAGLRTGGLTAQELFALFRLEPPPASPDVWGGRRAA